MREKKTRIKMTLSLPSDTIGTLREQAKAQGYLAPAAYARHLIMRGLKTGAEIREEGGRRIYVLEVEDADEIETYCRAKRHRSVPDFALFAMEQSMARHPLSAAQNARVGKRDGVSGGGAQALLPGALAGNSTTTG